MQHTISPPWGEVHEVEMSARWIWASNLRDTDEAFCRCVEGHNDNGLTYDGDGQFHIRVDDTSTLYVNGQNVGETTPSMWTETETFEFNAPCDSPTLYAVDGSDAAGGEQLMSPTSCCSHAHEFVILLLIASSGCAEFARRFICHSLRLHRRYQSLRLCHPDAPEPVEVLD